MKNAVIVLAICTICGCGPATRTGGSAESTIRKVFQAELPSSTTNTQIRAVRLMTLDIHGRFECDKSDLPSFLVASALLPDELKAGTNPLRSIQANLSWWRPAFLQDASGLECDWDAGADVASCKMAAGKEAGTNRTVVYFTIVYENKDQTGLRPEVKVDPEWGQQTNGISNKADARDGL